MPTNYFKKFVLGKPVTNFTYSFTFPFSTDGSGVGLIATRKAFSLTTKLITKVGLIAVKGVYKLTTVLSTKLGVVVSSITRLIKLLRSISTKLGITLTREEDLKFLRTLSTKVGLVSTFTDLYKFLRTLSSKVGLVATSSDLYKFLRTLSTKVGLKSSYADVYTFIRTLSKSVGLKTVALTDVYKFIRTLSQFIGFKSVKGLYKLATKLTAKVGLKSYYADAYTFIRTLSKSVGLIAVKGIYKLTIVLKTKIGLTLTKEDAYTFLRTLSTKLGLVSTYSDLYRFLRTLSTKVGIAPTKEDLYKFFIILSIKVGLIAIYSDLYKFFRVLDIKIGVKGNLYRALSSKIILVTKLGIRLVSEDAYKYFRSLSTVIGLKSIILSIWLVGAIIDEIGRKVIVGINEIGRVLAHNGPIVENRLLIRRTLAVIVRSLTTKVGLVTFAPTYKYLQNLYMQYISTSVGLVSSFIHTSLYHRVLNTLIGIITTKESIGKFFRSLTTNIGLLATKISFSSFSAFFITAVGLIATQTFGLAILLTTNLGLIATTDKILKVYRILINSIGVTLTKEDSFKYFRLLAISIGLLAIGPFIGIRRIIREITTSIGLISTLKWKVVYNRILDTLVGLSLTKEAVASFFILLSTKLGISPVRESISKFFRVLHTTIGLVATKSPFFLSAFFNIAVGLIATTPNRVFRLFITLNTVLGVTLVKENILKSFRILSSSIGLVVSGPFVGAKLIIRDLSSTIGVTSAFIWGSTYQRIINIKIGVKGNIEKLIAIAQALATKIGLLADFTYSLTKPFYETFETMLGLVTIAPIRAVTIFRYLITKIGVLLTRESAVVYIELLYTYLGLVTTYPTKEFGKVREFMVSIGLKTLSRWVSMYNRIITIKIGVEENLHIVRNSINEFIINIGLVAKYVWEKHGGFYITLFTSVGLSSNLSNVNTFIRSIIKSIGLVTIKSLSISRTFILNLGLKGNINLKATYGRILSTKVGVYASSVWYLVNKYGYKILKFLKTKADTLLFKDEDIQ